MLFCENLKVDSGFLRSVQEGLSLSDSKVNRNASSHKIVAAAYCAGLYPQLAKVTTHCLSILTVTCMIVTDE